MDGPIGLGRGQTHSAVQQTSTSIVVHNKLPTLLVLAAGQGRRFAGGGHKLEQALGKSTVLGQTLAQALATQMRVLVVTSPALEPLVARSVAGRDTVLLHDELDAGMGRSIAAGVAASSAASGWLVLPGDMPLVQVSTLRKVAAQLAHDPVVYAQHRGQRGHPVGFSAELYSELIALRGDEGARRLLARFAAQPVPVDDPGVLLDIDTAADLERARALLQPSAAA